MTTSTHTSLVILEVVVAAAFVRVRVLGVCLDMAFGHGLGGILSLASVLASRQVYSSSIKSVYL
jgi:hypothetical protein